MRFANVYWLKRPRHNCIWSQGYVGVAINVETRCRRHLRELHYIGNVLRCHDDIECIIVYTGTEADCLSTELLFRPQPKIGWNCVAGGGMPPSRKGCIQNLGNQNALGYRYTPEQLASRRASRLGKSYNKGCKHSPEARAKKSEIVKTWKWFNKDGVNRRGVVIPEGWKPGRVGFNRYQASRTPGSNP